MKNHLFFWGVLAIFVKAVLVTAQDEDERTVLVNNKCKCARITSRIIPSPEDPTQDIVERNIRIIVPLNNRENISDPTSPVRTKFVYHLSDLCKKCDPTEVELDNQIITVTQSNICDEDNETCYAYDRNKCYTNKVPLLYGVDKFWKNVNVLDHCSLNVSMHETHLEDSLRQIAELTPGMLIQ